MGLHFGDLIICTDVENEQFLQTGIVNDINTKGFDTEVVSVQYADKKIIEYEKWRMEGCFRKVISEPIVM